MLVRYLFDLSFLVLDAVDGLLLSLFELLDLLQMQPLHLISKLVQFLSVLLGFLHPNFGNFEFLESFDLSLEVVLVLLVLFPLILHHALFQSLEGHRPLDLDSLH